MVRAETLRYGGATRQPGTTRGRGPRDARLPHPCTLTRSGRHLHPVPSSRPFSEGGRKRCSKSPTKSPSSASEVYRYQGSVPGARHGLASVEEQALTLRGLVVGDNGHGFLSRPLAAAGPVGGARTETADSSTAVCRARGPQEENKWKKEVVSP